MVALLIGLAVGCHAPDQSQTPHQTPAPPVDDTPVDEMGDADRTETSPPDRGETTGGEAAVHCGVDVRALGMVGVGDSGRTQGSLEPAAEPRPGCAGEAETPGSAVYRLHVEELALLEARVFGRVGEEPGPVVEVHSGDCSPERDVAACSGTGPAEAVLEPGTDYYLWVSGRSDVVEPHFRLTWRVEQPACLPSEGPSCSEGQVAVCQRPDARETYDCWGGCAEGQEAECIGDRCATGPTIDLADGPTTVTADRFAYSDRWTAARKTNCLVGANPAPPDTPGVEVFARIEGVSPGERIVFDSVARATEGAGGRKGESNVAFFILDGCSASRCTAAGLYDDNGDNRFEWTVPDEGGSVWLVAEALGERVETHGFAFDVRRGNDRRRSPDD